MSANGTIPRMSTPQNDTSAGWAGWAISSFTNKLATASGEMQSKVAKSQPIKLDRSSSMPPTADTNRPSQTSASVSALHRQAVTGASTPAASDTPMDHYFSGALEEDQEIDEAWGKAAGDDFFDVDSEPRPAPAPAISFDDGGEPDFEGWLNAQAQAKAKPPLPRGLSKPMGVTRTVTTGSVGGGTGSKKLTGTASKPRPATAKNISTKPKDIDDEWGDAWD